MDFLSAARRRAVVKARAGKIVLSLYGDTLWRWEHQERKRQEEREEEAWRRRVQAIQEEVWLEEELRSQVAWLRRVQAIREEVLEEERRYAEWINRWQ